MHICKETILKTHRYRTWCVRNNIYTPRIPLIISAYRLRLDDCNILSKGCFLVTINKTQSLTGISENLTWIRKHLFDYFKMCYSFSDSFLFYSQSPYYRYVFRLWITIQSQTYGFSWKWAECKVDANMPSNSLSNRLLIKFVLVINHKQGTK